MEMQMRRQLEELKSLDKVFPDPTRTNGCYVQVTGEGPSYFAKITDCPEPVTSKQATHITDCKLEVKSLSDGVKSTQSAESLKYLARAYLCNINEIATEKLPPSLLNELNLA